MTTTHYTPDALSDILAEAHSMPATILTDVARNMLREADAQDEGGAVWHADALRGTAVQLVHIARAR